MSAMKILAMGLGVLGVASTSVQAGPMSRFGGSSRWITWISNQGSSDNGGGFAPRSVNLFNNVAVAPTPPPAPAPAPVAPSSTLSLVSSDAPAPTPIPVVTPAPIQTVSPTISYAPPSSAEVMAVPVPPPAPVDAYIDLNGGPYPNAAILTTGNAQPWYESPTAIQAFGGVPTDQQRTSFDQAVLSHVQQTFQLSGLDPSLTIDPSVPASHTISVVSNTANGTDPTAIGMTEVGGSGFGSLDKLASLNLTPDQLAWAVAHNVSHELMHSFGIGIHPDQTGTFLDSASATQEMLTNPNTTFSPAAVQLLSSTNFGTISGDSTIGAEMLAANAKTLGTIDGLSLGSPVPEPSTVFVWGMSVAAAAFAYRRKRNVA